MQQAKTSHPPKPAAAASSQDGVIDGAETGREQAFVSLCLAGQRCGVPVAAVRDILGQQPITRIPLAPPEIAGSLNLRGRIVTSIDLRRRLNLPPAPAGRTQMSLVAEQGSELYALLVDDVSEVLNLPTDRLEPPPPTLPPAWAAVSTGIYRLDDGLMAVLDVPRLLAISES
jgi:purine-binding chemotaxis protein CheW